MGVKDVGSSGRVCKVAFIGAGYMTAQHLKAFADVPSVELSGIFSRTTSRAESLAKQHGVRFICRSVGELYEKTTADLVVISVPELSTRTVCEAAFAHKWALLIEKPAGYNVSDAEAIAAAATRAGSRAYVALNRRHYSSTLNVLTDLASNDAPRLIHVQDQQDAVTALSSGQPAEVVRNWMYANSIHLVDYFSVFGRGKAMEVRPVFRWNASEPGFVAAEVHFDSGDLGLYQAVWNAPGPWAVSVTTRTKRWEMRPLEQASFQLYGQRKLEPVEMGAWDVEFKPGLRRQAELGVAAAMGLPAAGIPTLHDALGSMHLTQSIYDDRGR